MLDVSPPLEQNFFSSFIFFSFFIKETPSFSILITTISREAARRRPASPSVTHLREKEKTRDYFTSSRLNRSSSLPPTAVPSSAPPSQPSISRPIHLQHAKLPAIECSNFHIVMSSEKEASSNPEVRRKLQCTKHFDALYFCYSPVHQMQQYYRVGVLDPCVDKFKALFDCLMLKTKSSSELKEILETREREKAKKHIWTFRTPEEASYNWKKLYGHLDKPE